jgi:hypothetical protein
MLTALGTCSVVGHKEYQGIVHHAHLLQRTHEAANLSVSVRDECGVDLMLSSMHPLRVRF